MDGWMDVILAKENSWLQLKQLQLAKDEKLCLLTTINFESLKI